MASPIKLESKLQAAAAANAGDASFRIAFGRDTGLHRRPRGGSHERIELQPECMESRLTKSACPIHRNWGHFIVLQRGDHHQVKLLVVEPWQRLSMQRHLHRAEHWHVVSGTGVLELAEGPRRLTVGDSVDIGVRAWHRLSNAGASPLLVIEVQLGDYLGEDDIERANDMTNHG